MTDTPRTVVWFSAGAASAVAAKLILAEGPAVLAYTDPGSEHPDNARFITDCEEWFQQPVIRLRSDKYVDTWDVWRKTRFLNGPMGARCTVELKKKVRYQFERPTDIHVFGYTAEETRRADRFREQNPGVTLRTPLIEHGLRKEDCLAMVQRAGLQLPITYLAPFTLPHANCLPCVKGGMGYFNHVRKVAPEAFDRMARLERELNNTCIRDRGVPVFLDELDPDRGNFATEPTIECSLLCTLAEEAIAEKEET